MIYPIVKFSDPVLETRAAPVTEFDAGLKKLVEDMFESMYAAHGVGLAAPQIGISRRIAVIDVTFKEDPKAKLILINPEIIHTEGRHAQRRLPQHSRVPRKRDAAAQGNGARAECKRGVF
jgi:peptide deformylase